jgi:hypothetical protein
MAQKVHIVIMVQNFALSLILIVASKVHILTMDNVWQKFNL